MKDLSKYSGWMCPQAVADVCRSAWLPVQWCQAGLETSTSPQGSQRAASLLLQQGHVSIQTL